jgi:hypothetical protein
MNLIERAKLDAKTISSNLASGFAKEVIFTAPNSQTATVNAIFTEHNLSHDLEGNRVNSKNSHICIHEETLTDLSYPIRNANGEINLANLKDGQRHSVSVDGTVYFIRECYPSKTTGILVLILNRTLNG